MCASATTLLFMNKMRETLISIILLLLTFALTVRATDLGKDGFNYYKDYLRSKSDIDVGPSYPNGMLYLLRPPLQLYPEMPLQDYRKRTANIFKYHMLNKGPDLLAKRTSKTGLSLLMQSKQDASVADKDEHYCLYG